jgi:tripartite-type tricarboxylate transporter receptor subunit TctC
MCPPLWGRDEHNIASSAATVARAAVAWFGTPAAAATPCEIVKRAGAKLRKIVQSKNMNDSRPALGADPIADTATKLRERVHTDFVKRAFIAKATGVRAEQGELKYAGR